MNTSDAMEILRLHSTSPFGDAPFPHCDMFVLHSPGSCTTCDHYPLYQALRFLWGIRFTDDKVNEGDIFDCLAENMLPCPATLRRSERVINHWHGNRPNPGEHPAVAIWLSNSKSAEL